MYASGFGRPWFPVTVSATNGGEPMEEDDEPIENGPAPVFPDMSSRQNVRFDKGSGAIVL